MKKFLLNASSGIGDIMFFLPAVLALKETYPDSQIGFLFRGDETTKETVSSILSIAHNKIDESLKTEFSHCAETFLRYLISHKTPFFLHY